MSRQLNCAQWDTPPERVTASFVCVTGSKRRLAETTLRSPRRARLGALLLMVDAGNTEHRHTPQTCATELAEPPQFLLRNWHNGIQKHAKTPKFAQISQFRCRVNCPRIWGACFPEARQGPARPAPGTHRVALPATGRAAGAPLPSRRGPERPQLHHPPLRMGICGHPWASVGTHGHTWAPMDTRGCPCGCSRGTGGYMWPPGWVEAPVMPLFLGFVGLRGAPWVPASPHGAP